MGKKLSVILPTYNEKENIEELIRQIYHYVAEDLYEVIVVDDNSPDGTWEIVKRLQKNFKTLNLIRRVGEKGLPSAIWAGIRKAKGDYVLWMDCDLSHPPKEIPKLLMYIPQYDVVCASRYVKNGKDNRNFKRVAASRAFSIISNILLGINVKDVTSGFYVVKRKVFDKIKLMTTGYAEYCIRFVCEAKRRGFKIKEVGYIFVDREKGVSKTDPSIITFINKGFLCMKEILKLSVNT